MIRNFEVSTSTAQKDALLVVARIVKTWLVNCIMDSALATAMEYFSGEVSHHTKLWLAALGNLHAWQRYVVLFFVLRTGGEPQPVGGPKICQRDVTDVITGHAQYVAPLLPVDAEKTPRAPKLICVRGRMLNR